MRWQPCSSPLKSLERRRGEKGRRKGGGGERGMREEGQREKGGRERMLSPVEEGDSRIDVLVKCE